MNKILKKTLILTIMEIIIFSAFVSAADEKMPIYSVDRKEKVVSVTFDLNWDKEEHTKEILDILEKHKVKATFFAMGRWIIYPETNKEIFREIYTRGHEIGNHSYKHPMFSKISKERMEKEIKDTNKIIKDITGQETKLFRFPSGDFNSLSVNVVKSLGMYPIQWNIDSIDWKNIGEDYEFNRVKDNIKPGSIILYHNTGKYTPKNLEKILTYLERENYSVKPIGELIFKENYMIDSNGLQISK